MRENRIRAFLIFIGCLFLLAFALSPFLWMMVISLTSRPDFFYVEEQTFRSFMTMQNYVSIIADSGASSFHIPRHLMNSLIISIVTSVVVTLFASFAGYAVSRLKFPGRIAIPLLVLAMSMFPQISIVGFLYTSFSKLGILNTYAALIFPYIAWTIPIALWINMSYFTQIPADLDRAALVDGASRTKTLFKVILPIALPGIFSSFLLVFISCFNEFLFALFLTTSYHARTITAGMTQFIGTEGQISWGLVMAASAVASVPLVILTLVFQRYIVSGLASGSVKG